MRRSAGTSEYWILKQQFVAYVGLLPQLVAGPMRVVVDPGSESLHVISLEDLLTLAQNGGMETLAVRA